MDEDQKKNLKQVLKAEMRPLLIGLRNEVKGLRGEIVKLREKKIEEILRTQEIDPVQFPETQDVNVKNPVKAVKVLNPQKIVAVKGIKGLFIDLIKSIRQGDEGVIKILLLKFDELRKSVLKVEVQNQKEIKFPKVQKVELTNPPPARKNVERVFIENSLPKEAVPVVLVTSEKKRFYDMLLQVVGGGSGGTNPASLAALLVVLKQIEENTDELELKADTINLNTDELESLIGDTNTALAAIDVLITDISKAEDSTHVSGDKGVMGLGVRRDSETPLAADGKYHPNLYNEKGRLKVDAQVVIMAEPRPGLRVAEFLKDSGGSIDLNIDGSVTPVTFSAAPPTGKKWFIHSLSLIMEDASINFTKFGGITGGHYQRFRCSSKRRRVGRSVIGGIQNKQRFFYIYNGGQIRIGVA